MSTSDSGLANHGEHSDLKAQIAGQQGQAAQGKKDPSEQGKKKKPGSGNAKRSEALAEKKSAENDAAEKTAASEQTRQAVAGKSKGKATAAPKAASSSESSGAASAASTKADKRADLKRAKADAKSTDVVAKKSESSKTPSAEKAIAPAKAPTPANTKAAVPAKAPTPGKAPKTAGKVHAKPAAKEATALVDAEIEEEIEPQGYRVLLQALGSWGVSLIVHAAIVVVLFFIGTVIIDQETPEFTAIQRPQEELSEVLDQQVAASLNLAASSAASVLPTGPVSPLESIEEPQLDAEIADTGVQVKVGEMLRIGAVPKGHFHMEVGEEAPGDPQAVVSDMREAMDRITHEILMMLQKNKVLVVWLFDQSESMDDDRQEISTKIDRVYKELGLAGATKGDALFTAVASYGKGWKGHLEPTADIDAIAKAIRSVPNDESGEEQMCRALGQTIRSLKKYATQGRRQMAVILVTDESGDINSNVELLESTIAEAKKSRCRVYTLGREAVFGYPYAYIRWRDKNTNIGYWLKIDRGPETPFVEQLQTNGFWRRHDAHPSGFGPYEQARLARETNGIFFMLPSPEINLVRRDDRKYALAQMRPYMPSLQPRLEYAKQRDAIHLRRSLWKVIKDLNPWNPAQAKHINMRQDFSIDPTDFRQQAGKEMEKALRYIVYLDTAGKELELLRSDREKEIYPRWQANYDLMQAQVIAYKVRIYQYGAYLQWFLENPKKPSIKPPNKYATKANWGIRSRRELVESKKVSKEDLQKSIDRANGLFRDVMKSHPGTPWSSRAKAELARGYGVHLVQEWDDPRRGKGVKLPKY